MQAIETQDAPAPIGPYSQAVQVGNILYCSGQVALAPGGSELVSEDVTEQTKQVFRNISAVLMSQGLTTNNIFKTTIYLANMDDFAKVNEVYAQNFEAPFPARSTVEVSKLPKGALVEIEVMAVCK
jgi:2-iminobutanoate/2-iminopropanoate deaminase